MAAFKKTFVRLYKTKATTIILCLKGVFQGSAYFSIIYSHFVRAFGYTLEAKQVHLKISSLTLENLASHLMTKLLLEAVKSVIHTTNEIVGQYNCEEMHIKFALMLKSKGTNDIFCNSLERGFR